MKGRMYLIIVFAPFASLLAGFIVGCIVMKLENYGKPENPYFRGQVTDAGVKLAKEPINYDFTSTGVLCWVMTSRDNLFKRAIHVTQTWGRRCNLTLYVTDGQPTRPFPGTILTVPVSEGRGGLWGKTRAALTYIFEHYYDRFDWFVKADDDTFIIMDNLRYFLASKDTNEPLYYGYKFRYPTNKPDLIVDYMSGGAGYVMGKETLRRFMSVVFEDWLCPFKLGKTVTYPEDVMLGYCLHKGGVRLESSIDSLGRNRFLPLNLELFINGLTEVEWLPRMSQDAVTMGLDCCSDYLVSIHYVTPEKMYVMDFVTQRMRLASLSRAYYPPL